MELRMGHWPLLSGLKLTRLWAAGLLALALCSCARATGSGTEPVRRQQAGMVSCSGARLILRQHGLPGESMMSCAKALRVAYLVDPRAFGSGGSASTAMRSPSFLPTSSPEPPGDPRQVLTGDAILQWEQAGTTITSLWLDLEDGVNVEVIAAGIKSNPSAGQITLVLFDQATGQAATINDYSGGTYSPADGGGPVMLTGVTGSLPGGDMEVYFADEVGHWILDPVTGEIQKAP